jgi:hypothetical protein
MMAATRTDITMATGATKNMAIQVVAMVEALTCGNSKGRSGNTGIPKVAMVGATMRDSVIP